MLTSWSALWPLDRLVNDVMNDVMTSTFGVVTRTEPLAPAVDIRSTAQELVFAMDVPGIKKDDLEVVLQDGVLTIRGERKYEYDEQDKVLLGRSYGAFTRSFVLPDTVDTEQLSAELADGVLTIRLPRHAKAQPRRIEIADGNGGSKQLPAENAA